MAQDGENEALKSRTPPLSYYTPMKPPNSLIAWHIGLSPKINIDKKDKRARKDILKEKHIRSTQHTPVPIFELLDAPTKLHQLTNLCEITPR
jgi:hypothetical protein